MIVLTNCLAEKTDEGCLKVANSMIPALKTSNPTITLVSCGKEKLQCDAHLPANKLLLSRGLWKFMLSRDEPILYIPAFARMMPTTFRLCMLSLMSKNKVWALLSMKSRFCLLSKLMLKASGARVIALSNESWQMYHALIGSRAVYLKTGVDTKRFVPAAPERKKELRIKYGVPADKPLVLHVGHMKTGRNVLKLASVDERFHVALVTSTLTKEEQDIEVRRELEACRNISLLDSYYPNIEEIYQMADVYLFPVVSESSCIDVPLSVLEAAACGLPVVTTPFGELEQLIGKPGFYCLDSLETENVNALLARAVQEKKSARESVLAYDWESAAAQLLRIMKNEKQK